MFISNDMETEERRVLQDAKLAEIECKLDKLSKDVEDLVNAWKAASWLVSMVKWVGGLSTAITATYLLIKDMR